VLLLRLRAEWEVLLVERPSRGFFGGIWAFPGGAVDTSDASVDEFGFSDPWRAAALRETAEEVGVFITDPQSAQPQRRSGMPVSRTVGEFAARFDPARLTYVSSWITPESAPRRFEARFYSAVVDGEVEGSIESDELVDLEWATPAEVLSRVESEKWAMIFPTVWHIELLAEAEDPTRLVPHPIRQLAPDGDDWSVIDLGMPREEVTP
jgi:8-oxo-dGTP pyrophosphatase MutT (NUDIX family)